MSYLHQRGRRVPSSVHQALPGQVPNSTGGHTWQIEPLARLRRFLILGAEGGSYHIKQEKLVAGNITALAEADPIQAVSLIVEVSQGGLAPKNDPALFALAYYAGYGHPHPSKEDIRVRQAALDMLPYVARTATHLFTFASFVENQRGWGRSLRRAIGKWYTDKTVDDAAYQMVKYRQRDGWTHYDLLALAHPRLDAVDNPSLPVSDEMLALFQWVRAYMHPKDPRRKKKDTVDLPPVVKGFVRAQKVKGIYPEKAALLVTKYGLPWEAIPDEHLGNAAVWEALLYGGQASYSMPAGAMLRNLPRMTRVGLLEPMGNHTAHVCRVLTDESILKKARIHPLQMLVALLTYASGQSLRGDSEWQPVREIVDALDAGFYKAFGTLEPTGKRHMLALDVSASMDWGPGTAWGGQKRTWVNNVPGLTPRIASAAMLLVTANQGDPYMVTAFSSHGSFSPQVPRSTNGLTELAISPNQRIQDVVESVNNLPHSATNLALPVMHALNHKVKVDVFVVYTDNEVNEGVHPAQALEKYRSVMNIDAKMVVVGMVSNGFSIADPNDPGMMDVVGFDAAAPQIMTEFARGDV